MSIVLLLFGLLIPYSIHTNLREEKCINLAIDTFDIHLLDRRSLNRFCGQHVKRDDDGNKIEDGAAFCGCILMGLEIIMINEDCEYFDVWVHEMRHATDYLKSSRRC